MKLRAYPRQAQSRVGRDTDKRIKIERRKTYDLESVRITLLVGSSGRLGLQTDETLQSRGESLECKEAGHGCGERGDEPSGGQAISQVVVPRRTEYKSTESW